jgi:ubiquinone biosynthesis protein
MPTELIMVGKALMTVEGVGKEIYPQLDVWSELRPYFLRLLWRRYSPERIGRELLRGLGELGTAATSLPRQVHSILEDLRRGQLELRAPDPNLPHAADRLGRRVFSSVTIGAFTMAGVVLLCFSTHYEWLAALLLSLAGAQLLLHLWGDVRRKLKK